jgi:hypothetical protein
MRGNLKQGQTNNKFYFLTFELDSSKAQGFF